MKTHPSIHFSALLLLASTLFLSTSDAQAQNALVSANTNQTKQAEAYPIDLPTVLRLANAQNLDVQIARQKLRESEANRESALEQYFPWVAPGATYRRRDGFSQFFPSGVVTNAHLESYSPGATLAAQVNFGDAIYNSLAAKQLVKASSQALETQRQDSLLAAAQGYFDLAKAKALVSVVHQALAISRDYQRQLHSAVEVGIAFKGDELRVQTQSGSYEIALRQAMEQQRIAAAKLALVLHLDPMVELVPQDGEMARLTLIQTNVMLETLVQRALQSRPELKQGKALLAAARETKNGAVYGPLIPYLSAQVFAGGFGGGPLDGHGSFGQAEDYQFTLGWRIGPGGLFDFGRVHASKARLASVQLSDSKLKDTIVTEVVAGFTRVNSTAAQIDLAVANLSTADETLRLTQQRKDFAVGVVLEDIQAQQALTQARSDYVTAVAEYNKAQYALQIAVGKTPSETEFRGTNQPPLQMNHR
jgi:outer membrane protein TolC